MGVLGWGGEQKKKGRKVGGAKENDKMCHRERQQKNEE